MAAMLPQWVGRRAASAAARRAHPLAVPLTPRARVQSSYDAVIIGAGHNGLVAVRSRRAQAVLPSRN
jgi:hypothetical protein